MKRARPISMWENLQKEIINCEKCPRLVEHRETIARERRKEFRNFDYWGKPVPSYGSIDARLIIIGLAPAGHGGNRTGRMFCGDNSAKFLFSHLYEAGFAKKPNSDHKLDGQEIYDCYITAAAHCAPPDNKLTPVEIENCFDYLAREFDLFQNPKAILALGKVAFDSIQKIAKRKYGVDDKLEFSHGKSYRFSNGFPTLFVSYHPSPRNTQTGKLTSKMFAKILNDVRTELDRHR